MKSLTTILIICAMGVLTSCTAQIEKKLETSKQKEQTLKKDSSKPMNLVDEQMKLLGGIFSTIDTGDEVNPFAGSKNYLEVIDKMDAPEETKQYMRDQYKLYELSLDPNKKDSLELIVNKKLDELISKGQEGLNTNH